MASPRPASWRDAATALLALALAIVVAAAHVAPSPWVQAWPDSVRDLGESLTLARGQAFPLHGPRINAGPNLGPEWIWLEAIPLLFSKTIAGAALWVAAIGSLWVPLLAACAIAARRPKLAPCLVAGAAFPTVAVFQWQVFFQPDWAAVAVVASALAALQAWRTARPAWWIVSFLVLGLGIQLHPTTVFYAPFLALAATWRESGAARKAAWLAALGACLAIWFLPLAFAEPIDAATRWKAGGDRVLFGLEVFKPRAVVAVLGSVYGFIPLAVGDTYATPLGVPSVAWRALLTVAALGVAAGGVSRLATRGRERAFFLVAIAVWLAGFTIATAVRHYTSFYLVYFLLPLSALVLGLALHGGLDSPRRLLRAFGILGIAACIAMSVIASAGAVATGKRGFLESSLPSLGDLKNPQPVVLRGRSFGASTRDAFAQEACAQPAAVGVHGDLAYVWAASATLDFRLHCPARPVPAKLFGSMAGPGWTVLTGGEARALGRRVRFEAGGLAIVDVKRVLNPAPRAIEPGWYDFEVLRDRAPFAPVSLEAPGEAGDVLVVQRLKPFDGRFSGLRVAVDGAPVPPCFETFNSAGYCAPAGGGPIRWHVAFETDAPHWVDVFVF